MDYLQEGINLRAMGQKDPLVEWQREGFEMFGKLMQPIDNDYVRYVMHVQVQLEPEAAPDYTQATFEAADDPVAGLAAAVLPDGTEPDEPGLAGAGPPGAGMPGAGPQGAGPRRAPAPRVAAQAAIPARARADVAPRAAVAAGPAAGADVVAARAAARRSPATTPAPAGAARSTSSATAQPEGP